MTAIVDFEVSPDIFLDLQICAGDSLFIDGDWVSTTGTYTEVYSASSGCDSTIHFDLTVNEAQIIEIPVDLCEGDWFFFGTDSTNIGGEIQLVTSSVLTGCDSVNVYAISFLPPEEFYKEKNICEGDSVFLGGEWVSDEGLYVDTLYPAGSCPEVHLTDLRVLRPASIAVGDTAICLGDSIQLVATGSTDYQWFPPEGLSCANCPDPWVSPEATTVYSVHSLDQCANETPSETMIEVLALPEVDAGEDQTARPGTPIQLDAEGYGSGELLYYWERDGQVICMDCPEWTTIVDGTEIFTVYIVDEYGCISSDDLRVSYDESCFDGSYDPANAFSPNGDGANDEFVIRYDGPSYVERVRVYNRWGELLLETNDPEVHWDGTYRGRLLDPGVYVYYLDGICADGNKFREVGNVTLIR